LIKQNHEGQPHQDEGQNKEENKLQKRAFFIVKLLQRGRPVHVRDSLQRYEGCFTFGAVRKCFPLLLILLVVLRLGAQPVCVKPERIPAIRFALQVPDESAVDRKGPWLLSEPVALKYGLLLKGPVDERLDSSCAQFAAEAQWKKALLVYQDSVLADIALAVSPAYAVRMAKRWRLDSCERERDLNRIRQAEISKEWMAQSGWSQGKLLEARLLWSEVSPVVAAAPVLTALVAPVSVVGTDGSNASSAAVGIAETTPGSPSTTPNPVAAKPVAPQPVAPQSAPQKIKYVVKSGDSFWKIAKKFPGTTEAELVRLNKGKTTIYPGQILWIPR
jgi:LysM repeat protein